MKAYLIGSDYLLHFEGDEFDNFDGNTLETTLVDHLRDEDTGKKLTLCIPDVQPQDVSIHYFPQGKGWDGITEIQFEMSDQAYNAIEQKGSTQVRLGGVGNKIDIYRSNPFNY